jgi:phosphoenolpyruvate-protein phosphotransferase
VSTPDNSTLVLIAPMSGWSAPLDEVPDPVFSGRLLGDGVALDPIEGLLHAPCDGVVISVSAQKHAITLRAGNGAEILLHVGIDTVALNGEGFGLHVAQGAHVKSGDLLLTFDLDLLARRAKSLVTPVIVTDGTPFKVIRSATGQSVRRGDFLMELEPAVVSHANSAGSAGAAAFADANASAGIATASANERLAAAGASTADAKEVVARVVVPLEHGIHARPAAMLVSRAKAFAATVTLSRGQRSANARSAVAILALGVRRGEEVTLRASGPDAAAAVAALEAAIRTAVEAPAPLAAARSPSSAASTAVPIERRAPQSASAAALASSPANVIRAVVASPGIATGIAHHLARPDLYVAESGAGVGVESARLNAARARVRRSLEAAAARAGASQAGASGVGSSQANSPGAEILTAHLEFLDDPELLAAANASIAEGKSAGHAWRSALEAYAKVLHSLPDARMAERADDLRDLEYQVLEALQHDPGARQEASAADTIPNQAIILATDLLPSQFVALDPSRIAGICTAGGGPTSHVAVLAASLDIPMLVAAGERIQAIPTGTPLILDADRDELTVAPDVAKLSDAETLVARRRAQRKADHDAAHHESRTADGTRIEVFANVGSLADAETAVAQGAEGCGLLRTEFLFLDRADAPDESSQALSYQNIVTAFARAHGAPKPVVIRTLDVGGDKPLAYLPMPREDNPALGVRGIRVSLLHQDLLRVQLRAILRAQPAGLCRVLLPMVCEPAEVRAVRELLNEVRRELDHTAPLPLGAMIETPASALLADQLAEEADFLSIGTNDLTQYTLAMDRGNPSLAARLDALHPAVLRLIAKAASAGRERGRDVAVCGGLASDVAAAPILIGLGVNELSCVPSVVPRLKARVRTLTLENCQALARRALEAHSASDVRQLLAESAPHEVPR